jgi:hypothetical protein
MTVVACAQLPEASVVVPIVVVATIVVIVTTIVVIVMVLGSGSSEACDLVLDPAG